MARRARELEALQAAATARERELNTRYTRVRWGGRGQGVLAEVEGVCCGERGGGGGGGFTPATHR